MGMRPKFLALFAVFAFALVGCASEAPSTEPTATVTVTATPSETSTNPTPPSLPAEAEVPAEQVEKQFVEFAHTRADVHGATINRTPEEIVDSLHAYCDDGEAIKISKSKALNENMDFIVDKQLCESLD
ncbi:hypothetical protein [Glutamicibacter nicotianae]|uniref:hypothetical protein n=1 Tax=Glutamicibacter nicotianae TaxID=37929 RepID=UPI00167F8F0F|nr:hypothetical protein [Glutamicibacter nicotianae]